MAINTANNATDVTKNTAPANNLGNNSEKEVNKMTMKSDYSGSNAPDFDYESDFTLANQNNIFNDGYSIVNDGLMRFVETMQKVIKSSMQTNRLKVDFIPMDHTNHDLGLDIVLVATQQTNVKDSFTGVYGFVICQSNDTLGTETVSFSNGQRQFTISAFPSQIFQADGIVDYVLDVARQQLGSGVRLVFAGGCPVYTDVHDLMSEKDVAPVLVNAINACTTKAYHKKCLELGQIRDLNFKNYLASEETLEVDRKLLNGAAHDFHGNPIRADWQHSVFGRKTKSSKTAYSVGSVPKEVISITGYTDIAMVSPGVTHTGSPWAKNRVANSANEQILMPVNVFTSILPTEKQSLNNVILGLAIGIGATHSDYFYALEALNPLNRPQGWQHSIAGLGYEVAEIFRMEEFAPFPTPDTDPKFNQDMFIELLGRYFLESTSFAIEVGEGTPTQWIMQDFIDAAFEEENVLNTVDSANAKILAHTNHLFGGLFDKIYREMGGSGRVVFTLPNRRYLLGRYHNNQMNQVRSLQDIDRIFLDNQVNGTRENLEYTRELVAAQSDARLDVQQVIGMQEGIIKNILPHSEVFGYGYRLEIDNIYAKALHACMLEVGPKLINRNVVNQGNHNVFATHIGGAMIDTLGRSILTNYGGSRQGGNTGFFMNGQRRY